MKKKIIYYLLIILCIVTFIYSSYEIYGTYEEDKTSQLIALEGAVATTKKETPETIINNLKSEYQNDDIIGVIKVPGTNINHAFVQTSNNKYYLSHTLKKEKSKLGAIFMDYRNTFNDKQINIYGHNSNKYDVPFKDLIKYKDQEFTKNNNEIYITTKEGTTKYIIQIVNRTKSDEHMQISFKDKTSWNKHIKALRQGAIYDTSKAITMDEDILILQTCLLKDGGNYLIITATKEKEEMA